MPLRGKGKGKGRGKGQPAQSAPGPLPTATFYSQSVEDSQSEEVVEIPETQSDSHSTHSTHSTGSVEEPVTTPDDKDDKEPKRLGRKKKGSDERHFLFSPDQEDNLINWWLEHSFLYNTKDPLHLDKGRKWRLYAEKAKEFGCSKYMLTPNNVDYCM